MKARIDREQIGKRKVRGVRVVVKGRLRGMSRKRKRVAEFGKQSQQDRLSRIDYGAGVIYTKSGTIGVKVQSGQIRVRRKKGKTIRRVKKEEKNEEERIKKEW